MALESWKSHKVTVMERDLTADYERERDDALFAESQPYSYYATADQEAHYLFRAGYTSYCGCNACEIAADLDSAAEEDTRWFDFEATIAEIEDYARAEFEAADRAREREFAPHASDAWF